MNTCVYCWEPDTSDHECWWPVVGFEGLYDVSTLGRVRSLPRNTTRGGILRQVLSTKGYPQVTLSRDGKTKTFRVHTLVAAAFLGSCPPGHQVLHGPLGQVVNAVVNLTYGTPEENQADRLRDGTSNRGERSASATLTEAAVIDIFTRARWGESQKELAAEYEVGVGAVYQMTTGRTWKWLTDQVVLQQ